MRAVPMLLVFAAFFAGRGSVAWGDSAWVLLPMIAFPVLLGIAMGVGDDLQRK